MIISFNIYLFFNFNKMLLNIQLVYESKKIKQYLFRIATSAIKALFTCITFLWRS